MKKDAGGLASNFQKRAFRYDGFGLAGTSGFVGELLHRPCTSTRARGVRKGRGTEAGVSDEQAE